MQLFRRHVFRKLASMLALCLLLGSSASIWASVESLLDSKQTETPACHMQAKEKQHATGNCCSDQSDCMSLCGKCSVPVSVSVFAAGMLPAFEFTSKPFLFTYANATPDGTSSGLLYRPPISRA